MKFFLDTAKVEEIRQADEWGMLDGVTTNPSLVARAGRDFREAILEICQIAQGRPVSAEVVSLEAGGMIREARLLAGWADNIVVKIPCTEEGLKALKVLSVEGIKTNVTLVFSTTQGLMAAKAGGTYVSPFVGRLDDIGHDGMEVVRDLAEIFALYGLESEIIAASIRHPRHVVEAALAGADIATIPFAVLQKMIKHPLTDIGLDRFLADWRKVPNHEAIFAPLREG
ncbi:MAG TPA: fructose-6-phosphate aldolase [Anaerolineae bacterium]|nr:fructose-6-phosphate aldolase [Anaerolineae bacterium]